MVRKAEAAGAQSQRMSARARVAAAVLGRLADLASTTAATVVAMALLACWAVAWSVGGAGVAAPHWFYLPVLVAAARFGAGGALVTAIGAGVLAGPLVYLDVDAAIAQQPGDWITRLAFFVVIGQVMALILDATRAALVSDLARRSTADELRVAVARDEFCVHYQPVVELHSGRFTGVEALVRWQHPTRGLLFPDEFIPPAEATGAIVAIGEAVLRKACAHAATWRHHYMLNEFVCGVNVSAVQLVDVGFPAMVEQVLAQSGLPARGLSLEITETAVIGDVDGSAQRLARLARVGVGIAIDDFGTAYAGLTQLRRLPVDTIKINRSFVAAVDRPGRGRDVTDAVIRLAHDLGLATVAEGVETPAQLAHLRSCGCRLAQGYYFAQPLPPERIEPLFSRAQPFAAHVRRRPRDISPPTSDPPTTVPAGHARPAGRPNR